MHALQRKDWGCLTDTNFLAFKLPSTTKHTNVSYCFQILFGLCVLPFVYCLSFVFNNPLVGYAITVFKLSILSMVSETHWGGTGAKSNAMETSKWLSFCFLPGAHYWCKVWAALLHYFPRYSSFCDISLYSDDLWRHQFFLTKTWISLERLSEKKTPLFVTLRRLFK